MRGSEDVVRWLLPLCAACLVAVGPVHALADAGGAAAVTPDDLLANERFWPYQVSLTPDAPWQPAGDAKPLRAGTRGVLIRVEPGGVARIDFGRDGVHDVPVARTDLVARANRIRTGAETKSAPNLVLALGPRLVDPSGERLRGFPLRAAASHHTFLLVVADPATAEFAALAASLARFHLREGLLALLLPEGAAQDAPVAERLRAVGWPVPFVYARLAPSYAKGLLREGALRPALLLASAEGRVLYAGTWTPEDAPRIAAGIEAALARSARVEDAAARE